MKVRHRVVSEVVLVERVEVEIMRFFVIVGRKYLHRAVSVGFTPRADMRCGAWNDESDNEHHKEGKRFPLPFEHPSSHTSPCVFSSQWWWVYVYVFFFFFDEHCCSVGVYFPYCSPRV